MRQNALVVVRLIRLGRLPFVLFGGALYWFGALLAALSGAPLRLDRAVLGWAIGFCGQLSVSYSNDYFDVVADQGGFRSPISGGSGVLVEHPDLRPLAKRIAVALMGGSQALALVFARTFEPTKPLLVVSVAGNLLGWFYTAPPLRFAYRRWGDVIAVCTIGLLLPGLGYVAVKARFDALFGLFVVPVLLYLYAFIVTVAIPDAERDREAGKPTIAARKGRGVGFALVALSSVIATGYLMALSWLVPVPLPLLPVTLASGVPLVAGLYGYLHRTEDRETATRLSVGYLLALVLLQVLVDLYYLTLLSTRA
jgi:1,4-dihydroxy-2-naphthoate octaprenyltransferase